MVIFSWFKRKINEVVERAWENDWVFHKFYSVYTWFFPNAVSVKQYHFGKSWLDYLTGKMGNSFMDRPRYQELSYSSTPIDTISMEVIIRGLANTPVKKLELDTGLITDTVIQMLANFLAHNQAIEEFSIGGGSDNSIQKLVMGLKQNNKIKRFQMNFFGLSETGWASVADLLENNKVIQEIVINNNIITAPIASQLTRALKDRCIKVLDLSSCQLGDAGTAVIADYLTTGAKVETIVLANNGIQEDGLKAIATALNSKSIRVKKLNLSKNSQLRLNAEGHVIKDVEDHVVSNESGLEAIFAALVENTNLEAIFLSQMGSEKIMVLAAIAVEKNGTLRTIDLSGNICGFNAANHNRITPLAVALTINKTLETANLAGNGIDTEDLIILSQHMGQFAIKNLNLRVNNRCGTKGSNDPGLLALATGLRNNRSLVSLDLGRMNIEHKMCYDHVERGNFAKLGDALVRHPTLKSLSLNDNSILGRVITEMLLHLQCRIEHLDYGNVTISDFDGLTAHLADNPADLYLTTLDVNINQIGEDLRRRAYEAIKPINAHRKEILRGYYAFMTVGGKDRFGKERPEDKDERALQKLPTLNTDVGRIIAEYAGFRRPLTLL